MTKEQWDSEEVALFEMLQKKEDKPLTITVTANQEGPIIKMKAFTEYNGNWWSYESERTAESVKQDGHRLSVAPDMGKLVDALVCQLVKQYRLVDDV